MRRQMIGAFGIVIAAMMLLAGCAKEPEVTTQPIGESVATKEQTTDETMAIDETVTESMEVTQDSVNSDQTSTDLEQVATETETVDETEADQTTEMAQEDVDEDADSTEDKSTTVEAGEADENASANENNQESVADLSITQGSTNEHILVVMNAESKVTSQAMNVDEIRAVWLSYLELQPIFESGGEAAYTEAMREIMVNVSAMGMNTIKYQVRPFGDALYPSALFPSSYIITGVEGDPLSYDPFGIAVEMAHEYGLRIEAWINPYRIRTATSKIPLGLDSISRDWLDDGTRRVLRTREGILAFNPSNEEVRNLIVAGVAEIIVNYAVDGIHFDDYFYPTTDSSFDEQEFLSFAYGNDTMSQSQWRREQVNLLIRAVYEKVHSYDRGIVFGISPQGDLQANYDQQFIDVALWLSEPGYVDYIAPQVYFGFEHGQLPFDKTLHRWDALIKNDVKLIAGIAAYKVGQVDQWAGDGSNEWEDTEGILAAMIQAAKVSNHYGGFAFFRYDYLFSPSEALAERMALEIEAIENVIE